MPPVPCGERNVRLRLGHTWQARRLPQRPGTGEAPGATATPYGATVTPTFPTAGARAAVTLTRKGTSFVLKGTVPVPASATAGSATLAVAGTYGSSSLHLHGPGGDDQGSRVRPAG